MRFIYVWQECQYKQLTNIDQLAIHFSLDGNMIHVDSDEAKRQIAQIASTSEGSLTIHSVLVAAVVTIMLVPPLEQCRRRAAFRLSVFP